MCAIVVSKYVFGLTHMHTNCVSQVFPMQTLSTSYCVLYQKEKNKENMHCNA